MKKLITLLAIILTVQCVAQTDSMTYFPYHPIDTVMTTTLPYTFISTKSDKDIASEQLKAYTKECLHKRMPRR